MFRVQIISLFLEITHIGKCNLNYNTLFFVSHTAAATNRRVIASVHWKSRTVYVGAGSAGVDGLFSALPATLDPLTEKYPLQLVGFHTKGRVHSTYHNIPELREAVMDGVWVNPVDAKARGIENGDQVRIWNDRGETRVLAKGSSGYQAAISFVVVLASEFMGRAFFYDIYLSAGSGM